MNDDHNDGELRRRIQELRRDAGSALMDCDQERHERATNDADALLLELATLQARQQMEAPPAVEPPAPDDPRVTAINREFSAQFSGFDDVRFTVAAGIARERMRDPKFASLSAAEFARQVGDRVRQLHEPEPAVSAVPAARTEAPSPNVETLRRSSARSYIDQRLARQFGPAKR